MRTPRIFADVKRDLHTGTTLGVNELNEAAEDADDLEQLLGDVDDYD